MKEEKIDFWKKHIHKHIQTYTQTQTLVNKSWHVHTQAQNSHKQNINKYPHFKVCQETLIVV